MEGYFGQVMLFAGHRVPRYWATCNGQLMGIHNNAALFSIIGTTYGGDGVNNFALPKLTAPEGMMYIICIQGVYPSPE